MFSTFWTRTQSLKKSFSLKWSLPWRKSKTTSFNNSLRKSLWSSLIYNSATVSPWESSPLSLYLLKTLLLRTLGSQLATERFSLRRMNLIKFISKRFTMTPTNGPSLKDTCLRDLTPVTQTTNGFLHQMESRGILSPSLHSMEEKESAWVKASLSSQSDSRFLCSTSTVTSSLPTLKWCTRRNSTVSLTKENLHSTWRSSSKIKLNET